MKPSSWASHSIVALSVSTSARTSPGATESPSDLRQAAMLPCVQPAAAAHDGVSTMHRTNASGGSARCSSSSWLTQVCHVSALVGQQWCLHWALPPKDGSQGACTLTFAATDAAVMRTWVMVGDRDGMASSWCAGTAQQHNLASARQATCKRDDAGNGMQNSARYARQLP